MDEVKLKHCPSCGADAHLKKEKKNNNIRFGRVMCSNNRPFNIPSERCYMKTTAGPLDRIIEVWNQRL